MLAVNAGKSMVHCQKRWVYISQGSGHRPVIIRILIILITEKGIHLFKLPDNVKVGYQQPQEQN